MDVDELCAAVNAALSEANVEVADGRTTGAVTPRNVRYYRTLGLVSPPTRRAGRSQYDDHHVDEIVAVKTAQAQGASLEELRARRARSQVEPSTVRLTAEGLGVVKLATFGVERRAITEVPLLAAARVDLPDLFGWSVRIVSEQFGELTISGAGDRPTAAQLESIRRMLDDEPPADP